MPKVIIWRDDAIEAEFDPTHRDWRLGRSETNDIALMDPRKSVSRFHAELREENGAWYFIDLNSQNGSWHNGERVTRLLLQHDAEVSFGDYRLVFVDPASVVAAPPPVPPPEPDFGATEIAPIVPPPATPPPPPPPVNPDETLLMPSAKKAEVPTPPAGAPVLRTKAPEGVSKPRKGMNPVVLVGFLLALVGVFGVVAFLAYSVLTGAPEPAAVKVATPAPAPAPTPTPAPQPAADPADTPPDEATAAAATTAEAPTAEALPATKAVAKAPRKKAAPAAPTVPAEVEEQYAAGRRALTAQRFGEAVRAFERVLAVMPGFRDTGELLARSREGQERAQSQALADGQRLEAAEEWSAAVAAYERAGAGDNAAAVRTKMHAAGDEAYRRARQFDARNRAADAIGWYERAVEWLAAQDPRRETARARLAELKGGAE